MHRHKLWVSAAAVGLGLTLAPLMLPFVRFSYHNPSLHVALGALEGAIGLLVCYVIYGRFRSSCDSRDLLMVVGLGILGGGNLLYSFVPVVTLGSAPSHTTQWAFFATRLLGLAAFATGGLLAGRRLRLTRPALSVVTLIVGAVGGVVVLLLAFDGSLPPPVDPALDPASLHGPAVVGHPILLGGQIVLMLISAAAAGAFVRQGGAKDDVLLQWCGAGCVLAAFARINYFLFPSVYSQYVYVGDALRLGFYLMLAVGAAREIRASWQSQADAAVLSVRNAIARDLHDSIAQELVFIAAQTNRMLKRGADKGGLRQLADASDRAVGETRRAIAALTRPVNEPLDTLLTEVAEEQARRTGAALQLDIPPGIRASIEQREALVRIVRETVKEAARKADASGVVVELSTAPGIVLSVRYQAADPAGEEDEDGLSYVRGRVAALGGSVQIIASASRSSVIEVRLPSAT